MFHPVELWFLCPCKCVSLPLPWILAIHHCDERPVQKVEEKRNHDKSKTISPMSCSRLILKPLAAACWHLFALTQQGGVSELDWYVLSKCHMWNYENDRFFLRSAWLALEWEEAEASYCVFKKICLARPLSIKPVIHRLVIGGMRGAAC